MWDEREDMAGTAYASSLAGVVTALGIFLLAIIGSVVADSLSASKIKDSQASCSDGEPPRRRRRFPQLPQRRPESKQLSDRSASVYFTIASVVQGITVAVLGASLFEYVTTAPVLQPLVLLIAVDSFLITVNFWFAFVMAYFHLFRIVRIQASDHFFLSLVYFAIGLAQIVAFQFLESPRAWLSIVLLLLMIVTVHRLYMRNLLKQQQHETIQARILYSEYHRLSGGLIVSFVLVAILVSIWYLSPIRDHPAYAPIAIGVLTVILVALPISNIQSFQSRLDTLDSPR